MDLAPRAYRLKVSNAAPPFSTSAGTSAYYFLIEADRDLIGVPMNSMRWRGCGFKKRALHVAHQDDRVEPLEAPKCSVSHPEEYPDSCGRLRILQASSWSETQEMYQSTEFGLYRPPCAQFDVQG